MTEWDLLRAATAPEPSEQSFDDDHENVDWNRLTSLANAHQLLPALVESLDSIDAVPGWAREDPRAESRRQAQSSLHLTNALHSVLDALEDADVRAIPYKGPVLAAAVHDDVGARQYVDIDVLVPPEKFERACTVVESEGYEPFQRLNALGEVALENDAGAAVDLHRDILPRYFPGDLPFEELWRRRVEVDVGGRTVPTLDPVDRFVVLAVHGTKHCWYRLAWVHDVATLVATDRVPWDAVHERATDLGCLRHVRLACWLARDVFRTALPSDIAAAVDADPTVATLGRDARTRLREGDATPPTDGEQHRYQWRALDSWSDRFVYAVRLATIPSEADVQSVELPETLTPLYRLVRPVRLATRGGRAGVDVLLSRE